MSVEEVSVVTPQAAYCEAGFLLNTTHRYTTRHHVLTHTRDTHHHKDEMRALMEVASFITASPLTPCYPTNPVIATGRPDYRG